MLRALLVLLACLPFAALAAPGGDVPSPHALCRAAVAVAEREYGLPTGLLAAVSQVESGRRDPATGEAGPWPWTINAEGRGKFFPNKAEAVAEVRQLQAGGMRSIDVGCMQINQRHHPNAFSSLEEAFDPLANARYAARFLKELHATRGDWMRAVGNYHSNTPERAELYRNAVAAVLPRAQQLAASAPAWNPAWRDGAPTPALVPLPAPRVTASGPSLASLSLGSLGIRPGGGMPAVVTRSLPPSTGGGMGGAAVGAVGERGRGLDAYRSMPIPLAGRAMPLLVRGGPG